MYDEVQTSYANDLPHENPAGITRVSKFVSYPDFESNKEHTKLLLPKQQIYPLVFTKMNKAPTSGRSKSRDEMRPSISC